MRRFIQKIKDCMQDNRGLTLIELLIAVTILAIVSAPLLHSFLSSANTEVKARKMGDATMVAQNIMEAIEANEFDDVLPADSTSLEAIFGASSGNVKYYKYVDSAYTELGTSRPTSNNYYIGVKAISAGGQNYNALIHIDPTPYDTNINKELLSDYSSMDAVFQIPKNTVADNDRVITMDVEHIDNKISISVSYDIAGTVTTFNTIEYTVQNEKMPSIYLFYYPNYKTTVSEEGNVTVVAKQDTIVINNMQDLEFDLFLIKQRDETLSDTYLDTAELASKCLVEQHLTGTYASDNVIGATIYSNIDERLSYTIGHTTNSSMTDGNIKYNIVCGTQGTTTVTGVSFGDVETNLDTPNALVKEDQRERIYQVTVQIYSADNATFSGDALCTMTGTKLK